MLDNQKDTLTPYETYVRKSKQTDAHLQLQTELYLIYLRMQHYFFACFAVKVKFELFRSIRTRKGYIKKFRLEHTNF